MARARRYFPKIRSSTRPNKCGACTHTGGKIVRLARGGSPQKKTPSIPPSVIIFLFNCMAHYVYLSPVFCKPYAACQHICRILIRLLFYFTPSLKSFIGLLPSFLFFVKVPFVTISHLTVPPLTFFIFSFPISDASTPANAVRRSILLFNFFHSGPPSVYFPPLSLGGALSKYVPRFSTHLVH